MELKNPGRGGGYKDVAPTALADGTVSEASRFKPGMVTHVIHVPDVFRASAAALLYPQRRVGPAWLAVFEAAGEALFPAGEIRQGKAEVIPAVGGAAVTNQASGGFTVA
jgi:hypothetical protein